MDDNHGDLEIDENRLKAADPDGLYLFMLKDYPYMMTPDNVAAFTGTTGQEIRKLLIRRRRCSTRASRRSASCSTVARYRDAASASAGSFRSSGF